MTVSASAEAIHECPQSGLRSLLRATKLFDLLHPDARQVFEALHAFLETRVRLSHTGVKPVHARLGAVHPCFRPVHPGVRPVHARLRRSLPFCDSAENGSNLVQLST